MKLAALFLLASCVGFCQCEFSNPTSAACASYYTLPGTPNPDLPTFLGYELGSFALINQRDASVPQPKIIVSGQNQPLNGSLLNTNVSVYGPYGVPYMDEMKNGAGITTQDIFYQQTAFAAGIECNSSHYNCPIPTDCTGGIYLTYGQSVPAGSGPICNALGYYDAAMAHAAANGITIRGGFPQDTAQFQIHYGTAGTGCNLGANIFPGTMTAVQFLGCVESTTKAMALRYGALITMYQVVVEPLAGMAGIQQFSVADTGTIIATLSGDIKAISPTTLIGAAATGYSWPIPSPPNNDLCYWLDWSGVANPSLVNAACSSTTTGAHAALDFLGLDIFGADGGLCDHSANSYANELNSFQVNFLSTTANPFGMPVHVTQTDPPNWCSASVRPTQPNTYLGCLSSLWLTSGFRQAWQQTFVRWASARGIVSISLFWSIPMFGATPNQAVTNCVTSNAIAIALPAMAPNATAANYKTLANVGPGDALQGALLITGKAALNVSAAGPVAPELCTASPTGLPGLGGTLPTLPQSCYQPPYPGTPSSTVTASSFADLQNKISAATCGENIIVPAGTYSGNLVIPGPPSSGTVNTAAPVIGTVSTVGSTATLLSGANFSSTWVGLTISINGSNYIVASVSPPSTLTTYTTLGTHASVAYAMGPVVSWASGGLFMQSWAGKTITINSLPYTVTNDYPPDISPTAFLLTGTAGNQSGVAYSINAGNPVACPANNPVLISSSQLSHIPQYAVPPQSQASTACGGTCYFASIVGNTNGTSTITIEDGASGWYFAGVEATLGSGVSGVYPIVWTGQYSNAVAALPQYITFDRVLVDAPADTGHEVSQGIALGCVSCTVEYSNIWGIVNNSTDSQAILINNSTGPNLIAANHLEATAETMLLYTPCVGNGFPGPPGISSCPAPSDITVRLNHFAKPLAWQALPAGCNPVTNSPQCYIVKNHFETKMGQRVLVDSNIFDTTFSGGQNEAWIVNCGLNIGVSLVCQDETYTNNLIEHAPVVGIVAGSPNPPVSLPVNAAPGSSSSARIMFRNNLGVDIDNGNPNPLRGTFSYANGYGSQTGYAWVVNITRNVTLDHNTVINTPFGHDSGPGVSGVGLSVQDPISGATDTGFWYTNNFHFGSVSSAGANPGNAVQAFIGATWGGDVFPGDYWNCVFNTCAGSPPYPAGIVPVSGTLSPVNSTASPVGGYQACNVANGPIGNVSTPGCWTLDWALVGFTDFTHCNDGTNLLPGCVLTSGSAYHLAGTDGLDVGANVAAVLSAISSITW